MTRPALTGSSHVLPFDKLSAEDFERLCLWLARREGYEDAEHLGAAGQEGGRDVVARRGDRRVVFQCKRYRSFGPGEAVAVVEKILALPAEERPDELIFVIASNVSAETRKRARQHAQPMACGFWAGTELDERVKRHGDLLREFFHLDRPAGDDPRRFRTMALPPEGFVTRREYLPALAALRRQPDSASAVVALTTALRGAGGFGKTALAQALAVDPEVCRTYSDGILWTTLGEELSARELVGRVRELLRWWSREEPPAFETAEAAGAALRESLAGRRVLLVVDDVWKPADLGPFQGLGPGAALLLTTRDRFVVPDGARAVEVDALAAGEAVCLLAAGLPPVDGSRLAPLAARLGEWPLLLRLVNRQLRHRVTAEGLTVEAALSEVEEELAADGLTAFDREDAGQRQAAVRLTLEASLRRLAAADRRRFAELAVFPEDADVPLAAAGRLWSLPPAQVKRLTGRLHEGSLLLRFDRGAGTFRLHDVVRRYLVDLQGAALPALHRRLVEAYRSAGGGRFADGPDDGYRLQRLVHHLAAAGMTEELRATLLDFDFLYAALRALGPQALIDDLEAGRECLEDPEGLRRLQSAVRLCAHVLRQDPRQLPGQLLGRLPAAEVPDLHPLLEQIRAWRAELWLRPVRASLELATGPLLRTLALPRRVGPNADADPAPLVLTPDGRRAICGFPGGEAGIWSLDTGERLLTLDGKWWEAPALAVTRDGRRLLAGNDDGGLTVWDLESGEKLRDLPPPEQALPDGWDEEVAPVVTTIAISASGPRVLIGSELGSLCLWDLDGDEGARCLDRSKPARGWAHLVALYDAGRKAVVVADSGHGGGVFVERWDLATGREIGSFSIRMEYAVTALAVTADGRKLAAYGDHVGVWNVDTGAVIARFEVDEEEGIYCLAWTPDGRHLLAGGAAISGIGSKGLLRIWKLGAGPESHRIPGHDGPVRALAVTADGQRAVSGADDRTLKLWDLGRAAAALGGEGHESSVEAVAVAPDGTRAASAGWRSVKVWKLADGAELLHLEHHGDPPRRIAFSPDGRLLAMLADGFTVWDARSGEKLARIDSPPTNDFAFAFDARWIAASSTDFSYLRVLDLQSESPARVLKGPDEVRGLAFTPDGGTLITLLNRDPGPRVQSLATGEVLATLAGRRGGESMESFEGWVAAVAVAPDGRRAIVASYEGTVEVWDLRTGEAVTTLAVPGDCSLLTVTADGERLVCGCGDYSLRVVDLRTGEILACLAGHDWTLAAMAVTPDGTRAASAALDGTLRVWDLQASRELCCVECASELTAVALTSDGRTVMSAQNDCILAMRDAVSGEWLRTWRTAAVVDTLAALPDGQSVLAGSRDGGLQIWSLDTGEKRLQLTGHRSAVTALAVTADGRRAVSGSENGNLRLWDLETGREIEPPPGLGQPVLPILPPSESVPATLAYFDRSLDTWILERGSEVLALRPAAVSRDGKVQASRQDGTVTVRAARPSAAGGPAAVSFSVGAKIESLALSPAGDHVVVGTESGGVHILRVERGGF